MTIPPAQTVLLKVINNVVKMVAGTKKEKNFLRKLFFKANDIEKPIKSEMPR